jgi:tetratricopeptide (TPR) repeat protein
VLPVPKRLLAIDAIHNDQKISLAADGHMALNPRDSLEILAVRTDGWWHWGTRLVAQDVPKQPPVGKRFVVGTLWPHETFESPVTLVLEASWLGQDLGRVSLTVQLDARDWLQKASAADGTDRKIGFLKKALAENPANVLAKTQLAALYLESKKYAEAAELYEEIAEKGKSKEILERLIVAYQQQGRVHQVLQTHLDLLQVAPDAAQFKAFLEYLQKQKNKQMVADFLSKHRQQIPREYQTHVILLLAELHVQMKAWPQAAAAYEEAIRRGVRDPNVYYNLAVVYQQKKDWAHSTQALGSYLQRNPKDVKTQIEMGQLLEKQGAVDQARATYEAILKEDPGQEKVLLRLITLLEKSNDKDALRVYYEKLAKLQPRNKLVHFNLGVLHYEAKDWQHAAEALTIVANLDARDVESRKYLLDIHRKLGNQKGEMDALSDLIQVQPQRVELYDELYALYEKKKDYRGMADAFREALKGRPESAQLHQYLLYALLKSGNKKAAVGELEILIRLQPQEKKYLRQAANLYEELGNNPEAIKKLEQLLKLDPKNKEAQDDYVRLRMRQMGSKKPGDNKT